MPAVMELDPADRAMLDEALVKARHLVEELEKQKREIDAAPPPKHVTPEQFAEGRHAMIKAIASARRMLVSLEEAERIANEPESDTSEDNSPDPSRDA